MFFELSDHLGNVLATVLDRKTGSGTRTVEGITLYDHWSADLASVTDYYPGGMMMGGRNTEYSWSRMGVQGSPKDDEVYGKGNFIDMGDRHLDTRIIRTPKTDMLAAKYPSISPYSYVGNMFSIANDPNGKEIWIIINNKNVNGYTTTIEKVQYKHGELYDINNKVYKNSDPSSPGYYAEKVKIDLNQLSKDDKDLGNRVKTLDNSKEIHTIEMPQLPDDGNFNSPTSVANDKNGIPTGSETKYNPYRQTSSSGSKRSPRVGLAHELLGHGYDSDQGKTNYNKTKSGINMYEVDAVNTENKARKATGDEKRESYDGKDISKELTK